MPKVTFIYDAREFPLDPTSLKSMGEQVRPVVADLMSTSDTKLTPDDVDWMPVAMPDGSIFGSPINIEIETFGFAERKKKLREVAFKDRILDALDPHVGGKPLAYGLRLAKRPLVWIKYVDPDGLHI